MSCLKFNDQNGSNEWIIMLEKCGRLDLIVFHFIWVPNRHLWQLKQAHITYEAKPRGLHFVLSDLLDLFIGTFVSIGTFCCHWNFLLPLKLLLPLELFVAIGTWYTLEHVGISVWSLRSFIWFFLKNEDNKKFLRKSGENWKCEDTKTNY